MKNQYFADTRDLFKYDLVLDLLTKTQLSHFTFIPMLTPDEPDYHGGRTNYEKAMIRCVQPELRRFLKHCLQTKTRRILMLEQFFGNRSQKRRLSVSIYKKREIFSHREREDYFQHIPTRMLAESIILVDPDIGLEVPSMKGKEDKYLRYDELRSLYNRMDDASILLIFQFIPRVARKPYLNALASKIITRMTAVNSIHYVSDNQIAFFVLAKTLKTLGQLSDCLATYASLHGVIIGRA